MQECANQVVQVRKFLLGRKAAGTRCDEGSNGRLHSPLHLFRTIGVNTLLWPLIPKRKQYSGEDVQAEG